MHLRPGLCVWVLPHGKPKQAVSGSYQSGREAGLGGLITAHKE